MPYPKPHDWKAAEAVLKPRQLARMLLTTLTGTRNASVSQATRKAFAVVDEESDCISS